MNRTFDRIPRFDARSLAYPIRTAAPEPRISNILWRNGRILDQGSEGACVGFGWTAEAIATPVRVNVPAPTSFARSVYREAQKIDYWPGESYEGTSVLAGAQIMQRHGYLREYRWAFGLEDVRLALLTTGPVVLGVNWYSGMYDAPNGRLNVTGRFVGGHCILATGYHPAKGYALVNSWGASWGNNGIAWISPADLARLLDEDGEACVPFRRSYGPKIP